MANFIDCDRNRSVFPLWTILAALFAEEQNIALAETGQYAFRIVEKTADRDTEPISCDTKESFEELFRLSIDLASDNKPALRVVITDRASGAALEDVPNCTDYESLELFARNAFIMTSDGEYAVNLANIT
jgi:hypothetical protein